MGDVISFFSKKNEKNQESMEKIDKIIKETSFEEVAKKNQELKERLLKERKQANKNTLKSYRIK